MRRAAFAIVLCGCTPLILAAQARRPPTIDDFFAIRDVRAPQISPDGEWVAYTVTTVDTKADKRQTRVWIAPADGGAPLAMTAAGSSASAPRWSPDGRYLSFLTARKSDAAADSEPDTQVWVLDRRGGEARELTHVPQGVEDYAWSPDGARLAVVVKDTAPTTWKAKSPAPWVITRLQFKQDGLGYLDSRRTHLFVFDVATGAMRQVTSGDCDDGDAAWSPDGTRLAFVSNRTGDADANRNSDIWIVAADDSTKGGSMRRVTTNPGSDESPAWSPDGQTLAYVTVTAPELIWYATNHLAVIAAAGGAPRVLTTALDRNVSQPRFSADGKSVFVLLEDQGATGVARVDVGTGAVTRSVAGPFDVRDYVLGPAGALAALVSRPDLPGEIFRQEGTELRPVTHVNDSLLAALRLAGARKVKFSSRDGTPVEAFIYVPPDRAAGARVPTLLRPHGGPVSQYSYGFNFEAQLFAAHGYAVVLPNPRGSSGYGQDFSRAIWADWGNKDYDDVMAAVDFAVRDGIADPRRLGVGGWSYGGILTDYVITKTDRFAAAITGASEVLFVANYGHDHYQYEWEHELGLPWKARALWDRISPYTAVERIVTPTLIMGGEKDWNVPIANSEQLYQALRRLGRTTELVVYPGESHGIRRPSYQRDRLERYLAWYDRFLQPARTAATAP